MWWVSPTTSRPCAPAWMVGPVRATSTRPGCVGCWYLSPTTLTTVMRCGWTWTGALSAICLAGLLGTTSGLQRLRGQTGWCVGRVTGGGERSYGIYLHLAPPDAVVPVNAPGDLALLEGDHHVTVTKLDQDAVAPFTQGVLLPASVFVSLVPTPVERGKYAGQTTFAVHVDGRRIGEVTRRMTERYEPLVAEVAGAGVAGCEAVITRGDKGFEVSLMLPEIEA